MKKLLLLSALLIFACSSDSEGNPCVYEPTLSTEAITDITETSATLNGIIAIVSENCEVAPGEMQGFVYSTNPSPTNDDSVEVVYGTDISTTIDNLTPNTTYYVRVFITNILGEFYGNEVEFNTNAEASLFNCNGNPVPTIVYGTQEWTVENACHITYRDGTPIRQITTSSGGWNGTSRGAWCYYNDDPTKPILYNWYAIVGIHDAASFEDPSLRKEFAPEGWHVPTEIEWRTLTELLIDNGYNYDGTITSSPNNKLAKAMASTTGWNNYQSILGGEPGRDQSSNNSSGFNAFPEGKASAGSIPLFQNEGKNAYFWCGGIVNTYANSIAATRYIDFNYSTVWHSTSDKNYGLSVRLVKDN